MRRGGASAFRAVFHHHRHPSRSGLAAGSAGLLGRRCRAARLAPQGFV